MAKIKYIYFQKDSLDEKQSQLLTELLVSKIVVLEQDENSNKVVARHGTNKGTLKKILKQKGA